MERLLMKPMEVAKILGIGRSLVYELIATADLPSIRIGRCIRIPSEDLKNWIKERQKTVEY